MSSQRDKIRVACVQLDTKHADVSANVECAKQLVSGLIANKDEQPIDLVVLPELALTGYTFRDYAHIQPLLESTTSPYGTSLTYASELAKSLSCYVVIGFPERAPQPSARSTLPAKPASIVRYDARPSQLRDEGPSPLKFLAYNSAALFSREGDLIHTFRKHFLFDDDKRWASEGAGFEALHLPGIGTVCIAICMDMNPFEFRSKFEACELATFCVDHNVDYLIVPMAWLLPRDEFESDRETLHKVAKPSLSTVNYWALRCQPFFDGQLANVGASDVPTDIPKYLITANRIGTEGSSTFAGSSCVLQMRQNERPILLEALGTREKGVLLVEVPAA